MELIAEETHCCAETGAGFENSEFETAAGRMCTVKGVVTDRPEPSRIRHQWL